MRDNFVLPVICSWATLRPAGALQPAPGSAASRSSLYGDDIADGAQFEFVVVGAGAAGCAAAARLALAGRRVLLVEAGDDAGLVAKMPATFPGLTGTYLDWFYGTLSNNMSCLATVDGTCRFSRGKCLGGSTCINGMMYTRGNRDDYNYRLSGWNWKDMKPYFLRFEGFQAAKFLPELSKCFHNNSGIIPIEYFGESNNPWHTRVIDAFRSLHFPCNLDMIGQSQIGVSRIPGFISGGERVTTATAYLDKKNVKRKLTVAKNTRCTGIIIDDDNIARGVILSQGKNKTIHVFSNKEVILSAGAIGTVQLLLLSGIGPKEHLKQIGIPLRADLPVGKDMSDHVLSLVYIKIDDDSQSGVLTVAKKVIETMQWLATRSGPMTSISLSDITAFLNTECYDFIQKRLLNKGSFCELPTTQYIFSYFDKGVGRLAASVLQKITRYSEKIKEQVFAANDNRSLLMISPVLLQPKSRGWIRLNSSNPLKPPLIMPNFLSDERDVEEIVRAIRIVEHVLELPVYQAFNATILRLHLPGCDELSESYWACYVRYMSQSAHHAVGVAALGRVLDERLRVRGVRRLRVADAAALPRLPRGNTAAAVIALGERLSDLLLQDYQLPTYIDRYHKAKADRHQRTKCLDESDKKN